MVWFLNSSQTTLLTFRESPIFSERKALHQRAMAWGLHFRSAFRCLATRGTSGLPSVAWQHGAHLVCLLLPGNQWHFRSVLCCLATSGTSGLSFIAWQPVALPVCLSLPDNQWHFSSVFCCLATSGTSGLPSVAWQPVALPVCLPLPGDQWYFRSAFRCRATRNTSGLPFVAWQPVALPVCPPLPGNQWLFPSVFRCLATQIQDFSADDFPSSLHFSSFASGPHCYGRMARGSHGLRKVSLRRAMRNPFPPCG
jgi:hypothetical protein